MSSFFEGQQKALDWWKDWSKKMTGEQKASDNVQDWWQNWFSQQQSLFSEMAKVSSPQELWEQSPAAFQKWMETQQKFAQEWTNMFAKGPQMANFPTGDWEQWQKWMTDSNNWLRASVMDRLPLNMQPHLQSFMEAYQSLYSHWEPINKMMTLGITEKNILDQFINPEAYRELYSSFFGMKYPFHLSDMVEKSNKVFEQYIQQLKEHNVDPSTMQRRWSEGMKALKTNDANPVFHAIMEVSGLIEDGLERMYHIATPSKEIALSQELKDVQFNYLAFLTRSAEMQEKIYESAQFALPDTMLAFYEESKETKELPNFNTFFQRYLNITEEYVLEVLYSDNYSKLQSEVARLGVEVKSSMDRITELAFSDQPFLMQSYADEAAKEMSSLRRKVRTLEHRLAELEAKLGEEPVKKTVAPRSAPAKKAKAKPSSSVQDDFTRIEGIGAKISELLYKAGIESFQQLAEIQANNVKQILEEAGNRYKMHDPTSWPEQAAMAASGQWEKLKEWQQEAKGGKK